MGQEFVETDLEKASAPGNKGSKGKSSKAQTSKADVRNHVPHSVSRTVSSPLFLLGPHSVLAPSSVLLFLRFLVRVSYLVPHSVAVQFLI